jgi:hypothetical protein
MKKMTLRTVHHPDRDSIAVEIVENDEALAHAFLEPVELDQFIAVLAAYRAELNDRVAAELEPNSRLATIVDPAWKTRPHENGRLLALRHPGLGWLSFLLPEEEAAKLGGLLTARPAPSEDK